MSINIQQLMTEIAYDIKSNKWKDDSKEFIDKLIQAYGSLKNTDTQAIEFITIQSIFKNKVAKHKFTYEQTLVLDDIANLIFNMGYGDVDANHDYDEFIFSKHMAISNEYDRTETYNGKIDSKWKSAFPTLSTENEFAYILRKIGILQTAYMIILWRRIFDYSYVS